MQQKMDLHRSLAPPLASVAVRQPERAGLAADRAHTGGAAEVEHAQ
jgi:hypothetical protein